MSLKRVEVDLYVWEGLVSAQPSSPAYSINKSVITGQSNVTLEIAELVRDYLTQTFNDDYTSVSRYVRAIVNSFDDSNEPFSTNPITTTYVAVDGYGYFEEGTNPELDRHALISSTNIYLPEDTAGKLPIFAEGVGKVVIDSATTQITDSGNTDQKVQYITIPANTSTIQVFDTDDATVKKTITVTNICEPKFTPFKITFVNKFGAFQDIYFFKKTSEVSNVTDELFKKNIITNTASTYNTYENQKGRINVNAQTSLKMNTGFVVEDMNQTIEELFYSENVWIRYESKTLPVIPKSKSLQYKTQLNDNLINYTVDFDFAFDRINNIR
tara:strand:- start:12511 stop:13491 length:981 start_codon:yes stop_codon:yes gene_type:complete